MVLLIVASLLPARCGRNQTQDAAEPPPIEIRATVTPAQSMTISAQIDGRITSVVSGEGARVEAGQAIVQMANPAVERDVAVSSAQLEWVETRMRRSGGPAAPAARRSPQRGEITERILTLRKERLDKMRSLRSTNDVTNRELEQAEIEYLAALRDYNNERRLPAGPAGAVVDSELLRIERDKAAAEQRFAAHRQALLRVSTPISGVVTRLHVTEGQTVFPRDAIADITDVSNLHVRGNVVPELLQYVEPGMRVEVKVLGVPVRTFSDQIDYVIPLQGRGSEARGATVVVTIPNPDGSIHPNTEALITLRAPR